MSGFKVEFSVLNLKATPGIYADAFANRPAAGYPGRVFIDTDNPSTGIYRDTGTVWVQIAETATSDVDTLQNVTDNGNTTTNSISVGHANTPVATIDVRQSTSGLNNASNWTLTANNNPTIASGATFGTNYVNAIYGAQTQLFLQDATIGNSGLNTAGLFINTLQSNAPGSPGIITVTQASTIRAISGTQTGIFYGGTNVGVTYSHVAALKTFQPINTGSAATVTNNYGLIVADSTPSSGTITYTNRWGIYQEGASDKNYFAANVLIKSTTDNGNALQVTGNGNITGNLGIGTSAPNVPLEVNGAIRTTRSGAASQYLQLEGGDATGPFITAVGSSKVLTIRNNSTTSSDINFDQAVATGYYFKQAGTTKLILDASGNLGIGTISPTNLLTLISAATNKGIDFVSYANTSTVIASINFEQTNDVFSIVNKAVGALAFGTNSSERMRITSGGELLINTTTDVGDYKLQVNGNVYTSGELSIVTAAGAGKKIYMLGNAVQVNWMLAAQQNVDGAFEITPSTTAGGSTFTTPAFQVNSSGNGIFAGSIKTTSGAIINDSGGNNDTQIKGDNNANLFFCDASQDSIGIATATIDASALLQMDSTTKGFLLPRMTDAQINAISNPPDGLMVYSTDQHHIAFYDAGTTTWKKVNNSNL